jgi:hypothetical protein
MKRTRGAGAIVGQGVYKHANVEDISAEEIELRYRAALYEIQERSRRRRMEREPIVLGRAISEVERSGNGRTA